MKFIILIAITLCASYGQVALKKAVKNIDGVNIGLFYNVDLLIGILLYGICSISWLWVLKTMSLSKAYPFLALTFLFVPLFAHFFLGESISLNIIIGALLVVVGVCMINYGNVI